MHSLPIFVDLRGRPVILFGDGEAAAAKRRLIERAGGRPVGEDDGEARFAFIACTDDAAAEAAAVRLKARGLIVNVADRPALCDFTMPAIVDRDPVLIAIGTGGRSAGLAAALRQRLEALLPTGLGGLADGLFAARAAIRARWPLAEDRRRAIDAGLAEGGPLDPLADVGPAVTPDAIPHAIDDWLAGGGEAPDRLVAIRLRSADPDALTLGEARLLGRADRLYHRPDVPPAILARARADAAREPCAAPPASPGRGLSIDLGFA
ncbi:MULTISPECIES: precorrin-2 dehydrogenase/sirohydrochlorin ferrochelatase family protein [unclassified Sphingomonas]|uniref:precorrin-2 dehydrogenase/sirohydrochlorin ferrochelatase family protein n=1 Tax=unclassified Sphingomonas TaxID=196159 RepID=UPI0006FB7206|nr:MULTISPECIES: NAD(P)-dependent oxidoreductase [unclassified Sphingomonas]KQX25413.1 siroheme synthase [Sphingomonas sp. Root1294]KQY66405.1 siroheme synthase [Sphingomonas sp. Root50]KRB90278.1 siroheme synthase [Sphingomonas sp. Root720]